MPARLKPLELHGYKTFANRTLFEFAGTVTAIVGPNGSGKSNVADSLRWVLGEQSYGLLRARKTEDMIFSGSESRPRAGMAAASITFDNSDGWLPIDFSEVSVTRRAYRDGLNEYLINGQKVRLKDVSELLAQSGLAERTYTIIGQGLVDAALAPKADERRRLFEEAAGIGLHRGRREESLRRLETTKRNLERVEDILAELKPRLASLERQARRALEYEQLRSDLQLLLREWYGYHWHEAQQEMAEAQAAAHLQEQRLAHAQDEQAVTAGQLETVRGQIQEQQRGQLDGWHRELSDLHARREAASRELAVSQERERSILAQQESIQRQADGLEEEARFQQEQVAAAGQELARLQDELNEAAAQVGAARQALAARQSERARVDKLAQAARQELGGLNARQGQLQARLAESRAQAERAEKALEAALQALERAEKEHQSAEAAHQAARRAQEAAESGQRAVDERLAEKRRRLAEVEGQRKSARDERAGLAAEAARLKARLDVLDQAEAALTGYASGTRLLLQAARQKRLGGTRGALNAFLEVPAELEKAIAAALGDYLEAVVLDSSLDPALDLLQQGGGRGVLLPLDALSTGAAAPNLPAGGAEGLLGLAAGLVGAPPELRPAVDLLLGGVIVVQDRAAARRALPGQPAGVRAVTLQGEVFHASGPVQTAGGGAAEQTLLSRGRQRRELADQVAGVQSGLTASDGRLAELDAAWKALQAEEAAALQEQERARQEAGKARRALDAARAALDGAERGLRWNQDQRERQGAERSRSQSEITRLTAETGELEGRLSQLRTELRGRNQELEALSLDEFQAGLAHWNTRQAVAERALNDARARRGERQAALARAQRSLADLETRRAELASALQALQEQRQAHRQSESGLGEQIQALNARIEPAEAGLRGLEVEQAAQEKSDAAARQGVSAAEHFHAQARIALARRQETLQSLRRRIEDDFGLVAFEYVEQVSGPTPLPLSGMVELLPRVSQLSQDIEENIKRQRAQLRRMGAINPDAQAEYQEVRQRFEFMTEQVADLHKAEADIREVIGELDGLMVREFRRTFEAVASEFRQIFTRLFGGGSARLILTDPENLTASGIDIEARLPGRRMQGLSLLSGGERSLTAAALVFALLKVSPTPFCVLDEVDAMLDEANVGRFRDLLRELSQKTQFVVITHNRNTVQAADAIYGVTMGRDSASQLLSLRLDQVAEVVEQG